MVKIEDLDSFGHVAAEEDQYILDYLVKTQAIDELERNHKLLVLGRKGTGKTAIVRYFSEAIAGLDSRLNLQNYPWKIHAKLADQSVGSIDSYIARWKLLIAIEFSKIAIEFQNSSCFDQCNALKRFLTDSFGSAKPSYYDILSAPKLLLRNLKIGPAISGVSIAEIEFSSTDKDPLFGAKINSLADALLQAISEIVKANGMVIFGLHFDELDQGIDKIDSSRNRMLVGLICAARSVRNIMVDKATPVRIVVYLRTDIWDQLQFSDKNKISTESSIQLEWSPKSLLDLVNTRIAVKTSSKSTFKELQDGELMRGKQTK